MHKFYMKELEWYARSSHELDTIVIAIQVKPNIRQVHVRYALFEIGV